MLEDLTDPAKAIGFEKHVLVRAPNTGSSLFVAQLSLECFES